MKYTMDFNNKSMQAATVAVMNDILASDVTGSSMDDAYKAICKYANLTRSQFEDAYKQAEDKLNSWKNNGSLNGSNCELNEDDLDMVVGGSIGSFFETIADGLSTAACAVGNFVKEHAAEIAIVAGCVLIATGIGAGIGAGLASAGVAAAIGATACEFVVTGAIIGSSAGLLLGTTINN